MLNKLYKKYLLLIIVPLLSCSTKSKNLKIDTFYEIKSRIVIEDTQEWDSKYVIYPSAHISTKGNGRLIIKEPITIIGRSHVFDEEINIDFMPFALSEILPEWFGAKGNDYIDDTNAFKKVLSIAKRNYNSINIRISAGAFNISETLELAGETNKGKSINLIGETASLSSQHGSSLRWIGNKGKSLLHVSNINLSRIENLDFYGRPSSSLVTNIELRPNIYQLVIRNCTFKGCEGPNSVNININRGNNIQVSEIQIENCTFHGVATKDEKFLTESAIAGGLANTKNFYIKNCSFLGYNKSAIAIDVSDAIVIENNTFAFNEIDISCMLCNSFIKSNYSERSRAFFLATSSSNLSFTTMIGNYFDGFPTDGYVIRDGAGCLFMVNNNFGGSGEEDDRNNIKWEHKPFNPIFSFGNFYNNTPQGQSPFFDRSNNQKREDVFSKGDIGGKNAGRKTKISTTDK